MSSAHESRQLTPFTEFNNGMVPQTHYIGYVADRSQGVVWSACNLQEKLVLLWLQTSGSGGSLAELQETPNLMTEFRQKLNVIVFGSHRQELYYMYIVTRYDICVEPDPWLNHPFIHKSESDN